MDMAISFQVKRQLRQLPLTMGIAAASRRTHIKPWN
jgi:hypothetical protein